MAQPATLLPMDNNSSLADKVRRDVGLQSFATKTGRTTVKSALLLKASSLAVLIALAGCATSGTPSEVEKRFYKECAMNPPQAPCGNQ